MSVIDDIYTSLQKGRARPLMEQVGNALNEGITPDDILQQALLPSMSKLGERFKNNEVFVPEVMRSAQAFNEALKILRPLMVTEPDESTVTAVIGTVAGDKHDIGKNLVGIMLQGVGIHVIDLGNDVSADVFADAVVEHSAKLVGLSALLTTTMTQQRVVIEKLIDRGLRDNVKVIVGGAPVTEEFAMSIGADGYAPDAGSAAQMAKAMLFPQP